MIDESEVKATDMLIKSRRMRSGTCGSNGGEEERGQVIGRRARRKDTTTNTKM
jgi:hypothetical protein